MEPSCRNRKLFSCLMLGSHEGDLLRLHLNATAAHVAAWIVVEASFTHSGLPRTPDGALMASLRAQYGPKLVHAIERELPCRGSLCKGLSPHDAAFENEAYQRDQCARHVHRAPATPAAEDLLMVLDVDEVPSATQLESLRRGDAAVSYTHLTLPTKRIV